MSDQAKLYIAGIGMITPVGFDSASTAAAVRAGVSGYQASRFFTRDTRQQITMSQIPREVFECEKFDIDEGNHYSRQSDIIIKMSILAIRDAIKEAEVKCLVPLILAMPEELPNATYVEEKLLIKNLLRHKDLAIDQRRIHCLRYGRAAGIIGLQLAIQYLNENNADFVLLGGSDSYAINPRLSSLDEAGRVLASELSDGFVPGEGAGFLLLTRHIDRAISKNGLVVHINQPGIAQEEGYLFSEKAYKGNGLDYAFKQSLSGQNDMSIDAIYSSLNGENYWAKEFGVAYMRNKKFFSDSVIHEHPADCIGDLGSATSSVMMGLVAENLLANENASKNLVYCSSDCSWRSASVIESVIAKHS